MSFRGSSAFFFLRGYLLASAIRAECGQLRLGKQGFTLYDLKPMGCFPVETLPDYLCPGCSAKYSRPLTRMKEDLTLANVVVLCLLSSVDECASSPIGSHSCISSVLVPKVTGNVPLGKRIFESSIRCVLPLRTSVHHTLNGIGGEMVRNGCIRKSVLRKVSSLLPSNNQWK